MVQFYEYALNLACAPYAQNFWLHLFLGPVPQSFHHIEPSSCPSWIHQEYVMPPGAGYGYLSSPEDAYMSSTTSHSLVHSLAEEAAVNNVPLVERRGVHLPSNFLSHAVRSSVPLTRPLTTHMHASVPRDLTSSKVCPYLEKNLHWRAFGAGADNRGEIPIRNIPLRVWVTQTEVTELRGGIRTRGKPTIIWAATVGKAGGLQKGELPQVEPK
ncbi:MAG: hypothetical protein M1816_001633 [Peltula sp. TS41687]|nr:MAG: hypothetical protein M1816_001633 [Peltula sp. TS41687]